MADDTPQPLDELVQQSEDTPGADESPGKLPVRKIAIFGVIACVAAGAAWCAAGMLTTPPDRGDDARPQMIDESALPPEAHREPEPAKTSTRVLYTIDSIIVNLFGTEARRYLKTTITLSLKNEDSRKEIEKHKLLLTDRLIVLLSSKKIEDIEGHEGKEELKREIGDEVNSLLGTKDAVNAVYFGEFIIQ